METQSIIYNCEKQPNVRVVSLPISASSGWHNTAKQQTQELMLATPHPDMINPVNKKCTDRIFMRVVISATCHINGMMWYLISRYLYVIMNMNIYSDTYIQIFSLKESCIDLFVRSQKQPRHQVVCEN